MTNKAKVDMHIHTLYSDGDKSLEEVLKRCEEKGLEYISITDHNCCKAYNDPLIKDNLFSGKIIVGAEIEGNRNGKRIEFLAYNIKDTSVIEKWSSKYFSYDILKERFETDKNKIIKICEDNNLIFDLNAIKKDILVTDYFVVYMYHELIRHEENKEKMKDCFNSFNDFRKNGLGNKDSIFFMGENKFPKPDYKDVAKMIHESGALLFLAHPFKYNYEDTLAFIDELRNEIELDGIECYHPSAEKDGRINLLLDYANENNLYVSGGSDYHGNKKPNNDIAIGSGSLDIPVEHILKWIDK